MARDDDGNDPVGDLVDELVDGMVTGYVLFVYFIDAETGEANYLSDWMEGQGTVPTLGLLEAATTIERESLIRHHFRDDD